MDVTHWCCVRNTAPLYWGIGELAALTRAKGGEENPLPLDPGGS